MSETLDEKEEEMTMIGFMATAAMKNRIEELAKRDGRTVSGWLRKLLTDSLNLTEGGEER